MTPLSAKLFEVPPFLCALRAAHPRQGRLTHYDLAKRSGLSLRMVQRLSARVAWTGVDENVISRFAVACNVDLFRPSLMMKWLKETTEAAVPFYYLSKNQRKAANRRLEAWIKLRAFRLPSPAPQLQSVKS